jgi:hypothetical protein
MLQSRWVSGPVSADELKPALRFGRRDFDRYQHQLLSMQRIAQNGEPELAVIGCVTAIEWFLNSLLVNKEARMLSITPCLSRPLKANLSSGLIESLRDVANRRNSVVHGQPPERGKEATPSDRTISEIVGTGLALYREAQAQLKIGLVD